MRQRRARASGGSARQPGPSRWTTCTSRPRGGPWVQRTTTRRPGPSSRSGCRAVTRSRRAVTVGGRARRIRTPAGRVPAQRPAPAELRLLHAAAAAHVDCRRSARPGHQPGRRRVARRSHRRVRRGGGRALAGRARRLRPRQLRVADVRRGDGQFHGHGAGPRHPPAEGLRAGPPAPRPRPRRSPRLHLGSDPLLDRTGARRAGVSARHAGRDRGGRAVPAPRGARRGGDRQATGPPG